MSVQPRVVYREYIATDAWKGRRVAALERSARRHIPSEYVRLRAPRCEFCGASGVSYKNSRSSLDSRERRFRVEGANGLEVHHLHYRTVGRETPDDLIVLCTDVVHFYRWCNLWERDQIPIPDRVGCHERVHDDPEFAALISELARRRTY